MSMIRVFRPLLLLLCLIAIGPVASASDALPLLHPLFSDHAVLQRDRPVPVWGWADPGTRVTIHFADQTKLATAAADGTWTCTLNALKASTVARTLSVETTPAGASAEAKDLLVGDVWLCSGQSNMEMGITLCNEDDEIASAKPAGIRLLTVPHHTAYQPQKTMVADWKLCTPEALREGGWGGFSATAYFFGKKLHQELGVPIGLVHSSWGGTVAEAWTSAPSLGAFPEFQSQLQEVNAIASSKAADPQIEYLNAWFKTHDPGTAKGWHQPSIDTTTWRQVTLPGRWAHCGIPGYEGIVWATRDIDLPADWVDKPLVVQVGEISDNDTTWLNGVEIGRTNLFGAARRYQVPAGIAKAGKNTVTLRVTNAGGGGILADTQPMCIYPAGHDDVAISLSGPWSLQETAKKDDTGQPLVGNPNVSSVLYNGMIAPLEPAALAGAIWYQGEANASRAHQYQSLLPTLIRDWRRAFHRADLPFHIVSLANYKQAHDQPRDHPWAELREAQAMTAKSVPNCGLAITIDIGEANDIHPKNKREVGRRLALSALATTYGKSVVGSGPWFRAIDIENDRIRIHFDHSDGGLVLKGASNRSFAVAGSDRKFVWATPVIDGDSVIVSSPEVKHPVAVRYAWDTNPQACLYNGVGLPAVPFRSDSWPGVTEGK